MRVSPAMGSGCSDLATLSRSILVPGEQTARREIITRPLCIANEIVRIKQRASYPLMTGGDSVCEGLLAVVGERGCTMPGRVTVLASQEKKEALVVLVKQMKKMFSWVRNEEVAAGQR